MWNKKLIAMLNSKSLMKVIFAVSVLFALSCSPKLKYGLYKHEHPLIHEYLTLNYDSTFSFLFIYSAFYDSISGTYTKLGDTIIFNSIESYKPKIVIENSTNNSKLIFKDHEKESFPGVSCMIKLNNGTEQNVMSDFDGIVFLDTKEKFYIECSYPGFRTIKENIDISDYSNITIWLDIDNLGRGMRKFTDEKYVVKRNKLFCIDDSVDITFKYKRSLFK